MIKGWKTFLVFGLTGVLSLITALGQIDLKPILFPLVCHVAENAQIVADECTGKIIAFCASVTAILSAIGLFLRAITTSQIFKSLTE